MERPFADSPAMHSSPPRSLDHQPRPGAGSTRPRRYRWIAVAALLLMSGCAHGFKDSLGDPTEGLAPTARDDSTPNASIGRIQQNVMDFSDHFVTASWEALDRYISEEPDVAKQVKAQRLKIALATASMTIAASKDPRANLLDMAVFISAGKWAVDRYWIPQVLGDKAASLGDVYVDANREIEEEVRTVLTSAQIADLHALIAAWKAASPGPREVMDVRLRNLDGVVLSRFEESASARGLLANVRRWLGNVNQSLLYGERMMFYVERTPLILAQQADLTVDRVAERFPIATVNPNFDQWADLANTLPQQIEDLFAGRQQVVREALPEIRDSLGSLARISESLHGTLTSADALATKVQQLPFAPDDYAAALDGATTSLDKLNEIVLGLNRLVDETATGKENSPAIQVSRLVDEGAEHLMDELFRRAAILIGLLIAGLLLVVIVARLLFRRPRVVAPARPESTAIPRND